MSSQIVEKDMQTNIADTLCENIRLESNKMSNQFSKDFSKPTFGYLKSNTIQDSNNHYLHFTILKYVLDEL